MHKQNEISNSLKIGCTCIGAYLVSYCLRNLLSVSSPEILQSGIMTKESIGLLSSVYFVVYALGQLFNGIIGDLIKQKYMVFCGLIISGIATISFPFISQYYFKLLCFAMMGFGLSMLRGPLVKTISENMTPKYARISCVCFSSASFAGPLLAGIFAGLFRWNYVFFIFGFITLFSAFASYFILTVLERKGIITYKMSACKSKTDILDIFKIDNFITYMIIGMIVEISASSISFWIPAYMSERLMLSNQVSNMVFSAISLTKSISPFICLFILKLFGDNDIKMMRMMFVIAALLYIGMNCILIPWINIVLFMLALFFTSCASALLWSVYIPSLAKSGKVSSANGILDFSGYIGAAAASAVFSSLMSKIGWSGITFMWSGFMLLGLMTACIAKPAKKLLSSSKA